MNLRTDRQMMTAFNAISLTDIIFLLLIFFLLSSTFIVQPGIKVELPKTTSMDISAEKSIVVTITADGSLYLNDRRVSRANLGVQIQQRLHSAVGQPIIVIRGDRRITLEQAVEVMDLAKKAGAERFDIATKQVEY